MEPYTRQCIKNQASYWPSNRYLLTRIFKTSSKRSVSCNSATGWYDPRFVLTWQIFMPLIHVHYMQSIRCEVLWQLLQEHRLVDSNGVLWGRLSFRHHENHQQTSKPSPFLLTPRHKHFVTHSVYFCSTAQRGGDSNSVTVRSEGAGVSSL